MDHLTVRPGRRAGRPGPGPTGHPEGRLAGAAPILLAEGAATAVLIAAGLSLVIMDSTHGPVARLIAAGAPRRLVTGLLFGSVGALVTISPLGRRSGAHLNPAVTLAFLLRGKIGAGLAAGYVAAQAIGATAGAALLLVWGATGRRASFGATLPGPGYGPWAATAGEIATTFTLVVLLFAVLGGRATRRFAPGLMPPLYAVMVWLEAPVSGTSTNPARSLGPAVIAGAWHDFWVYLIGPCAGAALGVLFLRTVLPDLEPEVAKVFHFAEAEFTLLR